MAVRRMEDAGTAAPLRRAAAAYREVPMIFTSASQSLFQIPELYASEPGPSPGLANWMLQQHLAVCSAPWHADCLLCNADHLPCFSSMADGENPETYKPPLLRRHMWRRTTHSRRRAPRRSSAPTCCGRSCSSTASCPQTTPSGAIHDSMRLPY